MNVTVKLPDDLCQRARQRAVDESKSLSAWLADLMRRELDASDSTSPEPRTWIDAFSSDHPKWFYEKELPLEDRKAGKIREFSFESENQ